MSCCRPGKWGNPFRVVLTDQFHAHEVVNSDGTVVAYAGHRWEATARAVQLHRKWLIEDTQGIAIAAAARRELKGKPLMCFCPLGKPCHVDNLIDAAEGRL